MWHVILKRQCVWCPSLQLALQINDYSLTSVRENSVPHVLFKSLPWKTTFKDDPSRSALDYCRTNLFFVLVASNTDHAHIVWENLRQSVTQPDQILVTESEKMRYRHSVDVTRWRRRGCVRILKRLKCTDEMNLYSNFLSFFLSEHGKCGAF